MDEISRLLGAQGGVVARRQLLAAGQSDEVTQRMLRRGQLVRLHPGVYVDHTGLPTAHQRRWAAVLACWPAALSHGSAIDADDGRRIHVAVERHRHLSAPSGVTLHRLQDFERRVRWQLGPPRLRVEDAVLLTAGAAVDVVTSVAVLADACGGGLTRADRLLARLEELSRLPRRPWLRSVLVDIASGTCSVLEHGYLVHVERPHGLPLGRRQTPAVGDGRAAYRDVVYADHGLVVELDGRMHHARREQWYADLTRDLVSAARRGEETVRIGWPQVFTDGCETASLVGAVLRRRGWRGNVVTCPLCGGSPGETEG